MKQQKQTTRRTFKVSKNHYEHLKLAKCIEVYRNHKPLRGCTEKKVLMPNAY